MMKHAHIILLNGPSGSGKTTICRQLIKQLYLPYVHISIDQFYKGLTQRPFTALQRSYLPNIFQGFLASVSAFATAGNYVLLDIVLANTYVKKSILDNFAAIPTYLIGLSCPLTILEQRNADRQSQRRKELPAEQISAVHEKMHYDLFLDTEKLSPEKCADLVIHYLDRGCRPTALADLKLEFGYDN